MPIALTRLGEIATLPFDDIIDVRSPSEFAEDHIPGAINLPVLDDEERARVGTIYKQVSPFDARKIGAALVAKNAAAHLQGPLADRPGSWRGLVYCWRGGQRSGSFATILREVGWRIETVSGGYKSWRGLVVRRLYETPFPCRIFLLDGNTGSAKTEVLNRLPGLGVQVIDLEGLAKHRGSLFGALGPQPSQKAFEGRLAMAISALDPGRPVVVEAESAKIGNCSLPSRIWRAMLEAPRIVIDAPRPERARYLTRAYADIVSDPVRLAGILDLLRHAHSTKVVESWRGMASSGAFTELAESLMAEHYDPRYAKHRSRTPSPGAEVRTDRLDDAGIRTLSEATAEWVRSASG